MTRENFEQCLSVLKVKFTGVNPADLYDNIDKDGMPSFYKDREEYKFIKNLEGATGTLELTVDCGFNADLSFEDNINSCYFDFIVETVREDAEKCELETTEKLGIYGISGKYFSF